MFSGWTAFVDPMDKFVAFPKQRLADTKRRWCLAERIPGTPAFDGDATEFRGVGSGEHKRLFDHTIILLNKCSINRTRRFVFDAMCNEIR